MSRKLRKIWTTFWLAALIVAWVVAPGGGSAYADDVLLLDVQEDPVAWNGSWRRGGPSGSRHRGCAGCRSKAFWNTRSALSGNSAVSGVLSWSREALDVRTTLGDEDGVKRIRKAMAGLR
jgi:hypothetical protein